MSELNEITNEQTSQDFDSIMHSITAGLTGDADVDIPYLHEQSEQYADHEFGVEIARACGRLIYELVPEELKNQMDEAIKKDSLGTEAILEEAGYNIYRQNFDKALEILERLVEKVEASRAFRSDSVSEYHDFQDLFEEVLYRHYAEPTRDIRKAGIPFEDIYQMYGGLLVELKRYDEAAQNLEKGLAWNPMSFKLMGEYIETYKQRGLIDKVFELTLEHIRLAYRPKDVARCFRDLGYYFVEKELYPEAVACYIISLQYEHDSKNAVSELYYIQQKTGGKVKEPSLDEVRAIGKKYGFPVGADPTVLSIAYQYGKHFYEDGQYGIAKYFLTILYDLTEDAEAKEMLDNIAKKLNQGESAAE